MTDISPNHHLDIFTAPRRDSARWRADVITWEELCGWADTPGSRKESGNYVLGRFTGARRSNRTLRDRCALTLDSDSAPRDFADRAALLLPGAALLHTTYSHTPDSPRWRVIIPLDRRVNAEEYHALACQMMQLLGWSSFDVGSVQPARYMFRPAASRKEWYQHVVVPGAPLAVDAQLATWNPDLARLPVPRPSRRKRDPFDLGGAVGAFNRAYDDWDQLIQAYDLPYEPAGEADRYHLVGASSAAGMGPMADAPGLVFSHHVNDPAYGHACSAFDLVRLHRFGHLDEDASPDTPLNRLPSHTAMLDLATKDKRVTREMLQLVKDDFDQLDPDADDPDDDDWRLNLSVNPRTGRPDNVVANFDLLAANDPVLQGLVFNELSLAVETAVDLPWRPRSKGTPVFSDVDVVQLSYYLEREYQWKIVKTDLGDLVRATAQRRHINPVRDYLESLVWDGEPRLETCLPGVRPTPFTRLVARKCLTAAVARIMEPGIKWDHTLVLYGDEGLGKSYWIDLMSRGHSATLGNIRDKDTLLAMQRSWIMVADEGYSLRKADADVQKEFLTRTTDVFRMPYDRDSVAHPRHCVIWSTTNDEVFLRRQQGNRRFLIVKCEEMVDFSKLTEEWVDQVWAEAVHLWRQGELLWLTREESQLAQVEREPFTEEDDLPGIVQEYLDTPVPDDWSARSAQSRITWRHNLAEGMEQPGTATIKETCTVQLWVEALERRLGDRTRNDLLQLANVMKNLPGWQPLPGRHRIPGYGPQQVWVRTEDPLADLL